MVIHDGGVCMSSIGEDGEEERRSENASADMRVGRADQVDQSLGDLLALFVGRQSERKRANVVCLGSSTKGAVVITVLDPPCRPDVLGQNLIPLSCCGVAENRAVRPSSFAE
jgi:hypothetical protein